MDSTLYLSFTENGFLHSFTASQDYLTSSWKVHFLVMHCKNTERIYLGEYTKFRKRVLNFIKNRPIDDQNNLKIELDSIYTKIVQSYITHYVARLHKNKPSDTTLYEYGQKIMNRFQRIIDKFKIDINVTRVYQPHKVAFHFAWNGDILASYYVFKNTDTDKLEIP